MSVTFFKFFATDEIIDFSWLFPDGDSWTFDMYIDRLLPLMWFSIST